MWWLSDLNRGQKNKIRRKKGRTIESQSKKEGMGGWRK
jgi:hypothetical protein